MDMFIEKLVKRKRSGKDTAITAAIVITTVLLVFIAANAVLGFEALHMFVSILPFVIAGLIFVCYKLVTARNVEFEYSLTNNEMDIDRIVHRRKRKRIATVNARNIDVLAPISSEKYAREANSSSIAKKLDCSSGDGNSSTHFVVFHDKEGGKTLLVFEPNEKILAGFKRYSPNKVFDV